MLGWGIIGPGRIARRFAGQLPASRTGRLVAVASRNVDRAAEFGTEFGARRWYGDYDGLLNDDEVDAVYIATPHPMHPTWVVRAAEAGKHVLCEKPLAVNAAHAMAAVEAARRHDVFLMEAYMYRFHPQTQRLVELVADGTIGTVHQIQASFAFAASGDRLAVLGVDHTLQRWDVDTVTPVRPPIPAPTISNLLGFDSDGYLVVVRDGPDTLRSNLAFIDTDPDAGFESGFVETNAIGRGTMLPMKSL